MMQSEKKYILREYGNYASCSLKVQCFTDGEN